MRYSSLTTLVSLAVVVTASPTPFDQDRALQARDVWTAPARREVFAMRGGSLDARDVKSLEARKAEIARSEAELQAKREAEKRAAVELAERDVRELLMRMVYETAEARSPALEVAQREYEQLQLRELLEQNTRDASDGSVRFAKRSPQFGGGFDFNNILGGLGNGTSTGSSGSSGFGGLGGIIDAPFSILNSIFSNLGLNFRRDELEMVARALDGSAQYAKREPQFGNFDLNSILSSFGNLNGTTSGSTGSSTGLGSFGGLSGLTSGGLSGLSGLGGLGNLNSIFGNLGFNLRRDQLETVARALDGSAQFAKREPQFGNFDLSSILSSFGNLNSTSSGSTGSSTGLGSFGGLSGLTSGGLSGLSGLGGLGNLNSIFGNFGLNLRRDQLELVARALDSSTQYAKREPQFGNFNLNNILGSFGGVNGTTTGSSGSSNGFSGLGGLSNFGGLSGLSSGNLGGFGGGNLNSILGGLGLNLRRDE